MKWRIYNACCIYNIAAIVAFLVFFVKEISNGSKGLRVSDIDDLILITLFLSLMFVKNFMGRKLYSRLANKDIHEPGFGVFFYFLWILNVVCNIIILTFAFETFPSKVLMQLRWQDLPELIALFCFYLYLLTSLYCLLFDLKIEKLVRRQYDPSADLLKDNNA